MSAEPTQPYALRRAEERFLSDHGWLRSRHTFSFAHHWDPRWVGYRALRVINDDHVAGGRGFGAHPHRDMEIVSYVLEGALQHRDSLGTGSVIRAGDVQRMSAGTGVVHSEFNPSPHDEVHFLQIWIEPDRRGAEPSYAQVHVPPAEKRGRFRLVAGPSGEVDEAVAVALRQDARLYAGRFNGDEQATVSVAPGRHAWVHVARGQVHVNGEALRAGDALYGGDLRTVTATRGVDAEVLVFDLA